MIFQIGIVSDKNLKNIYRRIQIFTDLGRFENKLLFLNVIYLIKRIQPDTLAKTLCTESIHLTSFSYSNRASSYTNT